MYLCSKHRPYGKDMPFPNCGHSLWDYFLESPCSSSESVNFPCTEEGLSLFEQWLNTEASADKPITGVLCDWLQDHRDLLLSGAVGPNPAERLEQVIEWFRQHFERGSYAHAD